MQIQQLQMSYKERAAYCQAEIAKQLLHLMEDKKTNLAVTVDETSSKKLLALADQLGPEMCVLKTHIDILEDFDETVITQLQTLSKKHHFLIFEDRKFADIGNTVKLQYEKGIYRIADWAHITNAHLIPGPGVIQGLKEVGLPKGRGLLLIAEMSSKGSLATGAYTQASVDAAFSHTDFVIGFISQHKLTEHPALLHFTPGVNLAKSNDGLSQQYNTPEKVIASGADVIIVGRGITEAKDPLAQAQLYRNAGWKAYCSRIE